MCDKCGDCKALPKKRNCDCPKEWDECCTAETAIAKIFAAGTEAIGTGVTGPTLETVTELQRSGLTSILVVYGLRTCKPDPEAFVCQKLATILGPQPKPVTFGLPKTCENAKICCWDDCCTLEKGLAKLFVAAIRAIAAQSADPALVLNNLVLGVRALLCLLAQRLCLQNIPLFIQTWIRVIFPLVNGPPT